MRNKPRQLLLLAFLTGLCMAAGAAAQNIDIAGPTGSEWFGLKVFSLPNGNVVVTDPVYDAGPVHNAGAVYLYNGENGGLISMMTGTHAFDQIGNDGVTVLANGNFVVVSKNWDSDAFTEAGAVTWCSMTTGCPSTVSETNSLVGSQSWDYIGTDGVTALPDGNYLVLSPYWNLGTSADRGAITWGNGSTGISGQVSAANSLYGAGANDKAGTDGIVILTNGNYVVRCPSCSVGGLAGAGAATFCPANNFVTGVIGENNSLVGSSADDGVGYRVTPLTNGNYVVSSPLWATVGPPSIKAVGAATWANGITGRTGAVSAANSLVGAHTEDYVGDEVTALSNGNYVAKTPTWDNGSVPDAGAATWGNGTIGTTGQVSDANSLTGTKSFDCVGTRVTALANGNYVVVSTIWDLGAVKDVGSIVLANGSTGMSGPVTTGNALYGTSEFDQIGSKELVALANGNYVAVSPKWNNGPESDAGAVTWGSGTTPLVGPVTASNSLVGSRANDQVGLSGAVPLNNGNYVVASPMWSDGVLTAAGAATWANGSVGISGPITEANSLVGSKFGDTVGGSIVPLSNGNYVVVSTAWDNGPVEDAGAVTWGKGTTGITGRVAAGNSLVGSSPGDYVGRGVVDRLPVALPTGDYVVISYVWDNGTLTDAGAVTICNGSIGKRGVISASNSFMGVIPSGGTGFNVSYDMAHNKIALGRAVENLVTLIPNAVPAASASISGRVTDANGSPIRNAIVSLTAPDGQRITTQTGSMGFYVFDNVQTGQPYTVSVSAKRYRFDPRSVFIDRNVADVDIMARPNEF